MRLEIELLPGGGEWSAMRATSIAPAAVFLMLAGSAATGLPVAEHVHWVHPDQAWLTQAGTVRANADGVADVVVAGGERTAAYFQCANGAPFMPLNRAKDTVAGPASKLSVLNGVDGSPLWEVVWAPGASPGAPARERWHILQGVHTGDLDGDGGDDVLVIRTTREADGSDQTERVTMYDARTGKVAWETVRTAPDSSPISTSFVPLQGLGHPGGLLARQTTLIQAGPGGIEVTFDIDTRLVQMVPGRAPETVAELPDDVAMAMPVRHGIGYRLVSLDGRVSGAPPNIELIVDVRAVDMTVSPAGAVAFKTAWTRPAAGGWPVALTGGAAPSLIVGRESNRKGSVVAMSLEDGSNRWIHPADVGPSGGTLATTDLNRDGVDDVVASPKFGPDPTGQLTGGPFAELIGIDGATGAELWRHEDKGAKHRAFTLDLADLDGDGRDEIIGAMAHPDGFPLCSNLAEDAGMVSVYDAATGQPRCRFSTERFPSAMTFANIDGRPGNEVLAGTYGGTTWAFTHRDPGCGVLASPL